MPVDRFIDLDLDFQPHPTNHDVLKKYDVEAVRRSIRNLLYIRPGEVPFQPQIGLGLHSLLFEPMNPITTVMIRKIITKTIQDLEPRAILQEIQVIPDYGSNLYTIKITFSIHNRSEPVNLSFPLKRVRA